jgi:hypothetical protein
LLHALLTLFQIPIPTVEEPDLVVDLEETGYQPSFTRLATMHKKATLQVDPQDFLASSLIQLGQHHAQIGQVVMQVPNELGEWLKVKLASNSNR